MNGRARNYSIRHSFREILDLYVMLLVSFMNVNHHDVKGSARMALDSLAKESFVRVHD